uniref:TIGR00282 family metallophosphoesterase n=1 Tax=Thermodesulfovibrio aggregans TaxID=86166 RepID=A0A7C4AJQ0_9BACT
MQSSTVRVLFIGDIVGKPGRQILKVLLPKITQQYEIEFVIANAENAAGGFGITENIGKEIFSYGVDLITTGNHVWDKKEAIAYIAKESRVLRPLNYPSGVPGSGSIVTKTKKDNSIAVINVSGRVFMSLLDCPFKTSTEEIKRIKQQTDLIFIDFHAEATSEKMAFAYYFDGQVSAVIGTHTHVQTADEKILPKGTAYITDVGMTGPEDSIIGFKKEEIIEKFLDSMPRKFEVPSSSAIFSAVVVEADPQTGLAKNIKRLMLRHPFN